MMEFSVNYCAGGPVMTMASEAQPMSEVPSAPKATGWRRHDVRHMSVADRLMIK
jgi:hypothetical protein